MDCSQSCQLLKSKTETKPCPSGSNRTPKQTTQAAQTASSQKAASQEDRKDGNAPGGGASNRQPPSPAFTATLPRAGASSPFRSRPPSLLFALPTQQDGVAWRGGLPCELTTGSGTSHLESWLAPAGLGSSAKRSWRSSRVSPTERRPRGGNSSIFPDAPGTAIPFQRNQQGKNLLRSARRLFRSTAESPDRGRVMGHRRIGSGAQARWAGSVALPQSRRGFRESGGGGRDASSLRAVGLGTSCEEGERGFPVFCSVLGLLAAEY